jgi:hypothetical protein
METRGQVKSAGAGAKVFELLAREPQVTSERYGNSQWLVALGGGRPHPHCMAAPI